MSSLGLNLTQWTALSAIGTLVLALATAAVVVVTVLIARADRRRDDVKREQDRQWDSGRRKEDRDYDAEQRRQDREHAEQQRRADDDKWEQRFRAERREREDNEARRVIVDFRYDSPLSPAQRASGAIAGPSHLIVVRAPAGYAVKQLAAQIAHQANAGISLTGTGGTFGPMEIEGGESVYRCRAEVSPQLVDAAPIVRFTDRHGNLYYSYLGHTERFRKNDDFVRAANKIDLWDRTGPRPDEPEA